MPTAEASQTNVPWEWGVLGLIGLGLLTAFSMFLLRTPHFLLAVLVLPLGLVGAVLLVRRLMLETRNVG